MESRTKLAQAKSKGLTHTLITEAITSEKSWEDIKDLLQLKYVTAISTHPYAIVLKYNKSRRNPLLHTSTILREKLRDVISPIMPPP